jgi:HNH endonuclease
MGHAIIKKCVLFAWIGAMSESIDDAPRLERWHFIGWFSLHLACFKARIVSYPLVGLKEVIGVEAAKVKPDQYVLMRTKQDRQAAHRWHMLNEVRKKRLSVKEKIIDYFRKNVGEEITGEELKYLAKDAKEWARRVRELRTEDGWPIVTKNSGRDDLAVGVYVLEEDRQTFPHDRKIPDSVRVAVLQRDGFKCTARGCGWNRAKATRDDPRKMLELHHIRQQKDKGDNTVENLITLCNVHHDEIHSKKSL